VSDNCHVCEALGSLPPEAIVYDQGPWTAYKMADAPGWISLGTKRHGEGIWTLTDEEAASLGPAARSVAAALMEVTGAELVHNVYLGTGAKHYHMGFFPRMPGEAALFSNDHLLQGIKELGDPDAALATCAAVRDAIAANAT
jgi:diadenosine tetraphosphate (Ap4A) HIT family hydrolase